MDKKIKEINGYFSKLRESNKMYSHGSNLYKKITDELRNNSNKIKHLIDLALDHIKCPFPNNIRSQNSY